MKLTELLKNVTPQTIIGNEAVDITGVNIDSRKIEKGHLFVAIKGTQTDGHRFISKALELGAVAVLCEDLPEEQQAGVTYVQVASTEAIVGPVATVFYGEPSKQLKLVGVARLPSPPYYIICSVSSGTNVAFCLLSAIISKTR